MPVICQFRACHHDGEGAVATMPSGRDRRGHPACHHDGEGAPLLRPLARLTSFAGYVATMPSGRDRRDPPECLTLWREGRKSVRPCADLT